MYAYFYFSLLSIEFSMECAHALLWRRGLVAANKIREKCKQSCQNCHQVCLTFILNQIF